MIARDTSPKKDNVEFTLIKSVVKPIINSKGEIVLPQDAEVLLKDTIHNDILDGERRLNNQLRNGIATQLDMIESMVAGFCDTSGTWVDNAPPVNPTDTGLGFGLPHIAPLLTVSIHDDPPLQRVVTDPNALATMYAAIFSGQPGPVIKLYEWALVSRTGIYCLKLRRKSPLSLLENTHVILKWFYQM